MAVFDITPDDILALDDKLLRELIALLCKAQAQRMGYSTTHVTWGGEQTTPDGGLDVRVELPAGPASGGPGIPREQTGIQVKKPDMTRNDILKEMRPHGALRPVIRELAATGGAYLIACSSGTLADRGLRARRDAMRAALHDCPHAEQLYTDFLDRRRIADWVLEHPGVVLWVREKVGRSLDGWKPYGPWSNPVEDASAIYLVDEQIRVHFAGLASPGLGAGAAIDSLRSTLSVGGTAIRLVGLSGVGKTRFVQALFDPKIGANALPESLAVYVDQGTDSSPTPTPTSMATTLMAQRNRAILIVDNCSSQLHEELVLTCGHPGSCVSLVTVEYDVRDDLPERTQVVTIDTASTALIAHLIRLRHPSVSVPNARTIADAADGNARMALAIASSVDATETLAVFTRTQLFERLFWQRHQQDPALLRAAQACSLVYSFQGELLEGDNAELPVLAALANTTVDELYAHVQSLIDRGLVQRRSTWRAVLPHALGNHLATQAIRQVPAQRLQAQLVDCMNKRLRSSFAHRLSYLHASEEAVRLCTSWLAPSGWLGDVGEFGHSEHEALRYVAPVVPERVLALLESAVLPTTNKKIFIWLRHVPLIRSLAYEAPLFERCVRILEQIVVYQVEAGRPIPQTVRDILLSFFQRALSGTHASPAARTAMIARWLNADNVTLQELGRRALERALQIHISSNASHAFGARPRDYGYQPQTVEQESDWFAGLLALLDQHIRAETVHAIFARELLARNLGALWGIAPLREPLGRQFRNIAGGRFWKDGWAAAHSVAVRYSNDSAALPILQALESDLAPKDLQSEVLSVLVRGSVPAIGRLKGEDWEQYEMRMAAASEELGERAAVRLDVLAEVAPQLLVAPEGRIELFGRGLGRRAPDLSAAWSSLITAVITTPIERLIPSLPRGFIYEVSKRDPEVVQTWLDECLTDKHTVVILLALHDALGWDEVGLARTTRALQENVIPIAEYRYLASAARASLSTQCQAVSVMLEVLTRPGGFSSVLDALFGWLNIFHDRYEVVAELLGPVCRATLVHPETALCSSEKDHLLGRVADIGLACPDGAAVARHMARAYRHALKEAPHYDWSLPEILGAMFRHQTCATLDGFYVDDAEWAVALRMLFDRAGNGLSLIDAINFEQMLEWSLVDMLPRSAFLLSFIPVVEPAVTAGRTVLTRHARGLLDGSPAPSQTLDSIIDRFVPRSWNGSLAEIVAINATALDDVTGLFDTPFQAAAQQARQRVLEIVERERATERYRERDRDERFE